MFAFLSEGFHMGALCLGSQAVVMVLESKGETAVKMMVKLLQAFWKTGLITLDQMNRVSMAGTA